MRRSIDRKHLRDAHTRCTHETHTAHAGALIERPASRAVHESRRNCIGNLYIERITSTTRRISFFRFSCERDSLESFAKITSDDDSSSFFYFSYSLTQRHDTCVWMCVYKVYVYIYVYIYIARLLFLSRSLAPAFCFTSLSLALAHSLSRARALAHRTCSFKRSALTIHPLRDF